MIERSQHLKRLSLLLDEVPVVGILGARQVGKTTLARQYAQQVQGPVTWFDLEDPRSRVQLTDPMLALERLGGLIVLDEIQRVPEIYETIRVLVDRPDARAKFLVLGSASPGLLRQRSESLAGRIAYHILSGFSLGEIGPEGLGPLWVRGGFPRSYLATTDQESVRWRHQFVQTFLERDIPLLGTQISPTTLGRFWAMLAHWHSQTWNASEFARSFGVGDTTVRRYVDLLTGALVVRQLPPWHENTAKRQVKAPKLYVSDSGLLHALLGLDDRMSLERHPKVGASWEGFALEQVLQHVEPRRHEVFFWATHGGAELDLFIVRGTRRLGFEFKRTSTPRTRKSMWIALRELNLERLVVIYPGDEVFPLAERIDAVGLTRITDAIPKLGD